MQEARGYTAQSDGAQGMPMEVSNRHHPLGQGGTHPKITYTERLENGAESIARTVDSIDALIIEIRERLGVRQPPTPESGAVKPGPSTQEGLLPKFDDYLTKLNARVNFIESNLAELRVRI